MLSPPNTPLASIATDKKVCRKRLCKLVALTCLALDIVTAVIEGSQPSGVTAACLLGAELPLA